VIIPYISYGTSKKVYVKGHVLDDRLLYESRKGDKRKKNILAMISRYISDGIPGVRVKVTINNISAQVVTDENGLFETEPHLDNPLSDGWHIADFEVLDKIVEGQEPLNTSGDVLINAGESEFVLVSDVDDTILISHATEALKKIRLILTKNSKTRLPFTGVATFYDALKSGSNDKQNNPVFYVSSSEWNLYDFLEDFCKERKIPKGPFMLQELKTSLWKLLTSGGGTHNHKKEKIEKLMELYDHQKFLLVGDSGQRDASLYSQIAKDYPDRILSIYIRDVGKKKKAKKVNKIVESSGHELDLVLVKDSFEAAQHALENNYISESGFKKVAMEFESQKNKPNNFVSQVFESGKD